MPPTRQQSRARILRWERVVTGILNHFRWVRETGFRIFSTAYLLPRYVASERFGRGWKLPRPRPPELQIERWMKFGHNLPGDYNMMTFYHPWDDADLGTRPREMGRPFTTPFNRDRADPRGV